MNLVTFLVGMVGPLMAQWLTAAGLSLVTIAGYSAAMSSLKGYITSGLGGLPADGVQLGGLFGLWTCLGMILGTITFCITWAQTKGFWALAKS